MAQQRSGQIILPERLVSSIDLARTIREIEAVDESLRQAKLRKAGESTKLARTSATLEELARLNNVSLIDNAQRQQLLALLEGFHDHAPRVHISFAVEPSANFTRNITAWFRENINPILLIEIGLQPTLAAGCIVRTDNKVFDMSLRQHFAEQRPLLIEKLRTAEDAHLTPVKPAVEAKPAAAPVPAEVKQ